MKTSFATPRALLRPARVAASALVLGLLGACANMSQTPPGSSLASVESRWGRANFGCPNADGTQHLVWTQQPMGQYAWGANVDRAGNIDRIEPLLTDRSFERLRTGTWTPEQVRCTFGPPAETSTVGLPSNTQLIWSYRYRQANAWNSLMHVYFGNDGRQVTRFHPGPDPMFERGDDIWGL